MGNKQISLQTGCEHGCLYCHAREEAVRSGRIKSGHVWGGCSPTIYGLDADHLDCKYAARVVFPGAHDVTARNLPYCEHVLSRLLQAGNDVVIESKPDLAVWRTLLDGLGPRKGQVELRFSITHLDPSVGLFWEFDAPSVAERLDALRMAHDGGWRTSVACKPLLEPWRAAELVARVRPMVSGAVRVGAARCLRRRTAWCGGLPGLEDRVAELEAWRTPEKFLEIRNAVGDDPKVRWGRGV